MFPIQILIYHVNLFQMLTVPKTHALDLRILASKSTLPRRPCGSSIDIGISSSSSSSSSSYDVILAAAQM
jgi:hypothetical protein